MNPDSTEPAKFFRLRTSKHLLVEWEQLSKNNRRRWRKLYREAMKK